MVEQADILAAASLKTLNWMTQLGLLTHKDYEATNAVGHPYIWGNLLHSRRKLARRPQKPTEINSHLPKSNHLNSKKGGAGG